MIVAASISDALSTGRTNLDQIVADFDRPHQRIVARRRQVLLRSVRDSIRRERLLFASPCNTRAIAQIGLLFRFVWR